MNYELRIKIQNKNGFTLVETLVAISIFSISILGILSVLASGITDTTYAKDKIVAGYLAQEGIEYIRNMRDTYVLYDGISPQNGWNSFNTKLTSASCQTTGCSFDNSSLNYSVPPRQAMTGLSISPCNNGTCPTLLYDSYLGAYGYTPSAYTVNSPFIRQIKIIPNFSGNPDETEIFSTVSWQQGSGVHSITFSENLYNWIQ